MYLLDKETKEKREVTASSLANLSGNMDLISQALNTGMRPYSRRRPAVFTFTSQPEALDKVMIGNDTYQFSPAGGVIDDGFIGVLIGATLEETVTELIKGINGDYGATHPSILYASGAPAAASGAEPVFALINGDEPTSVFVLPAKKAGSKEAAWFEDKSIPLGFGFTNQAFGSWNGTSNIASTAPNGIGYELSVAATQQLVLSPDDISLGYVTVAVDFMVMSAFVLHVVPGEPAITIKPVEVSVVVSAAVALVKLDVSGYTAGGVIGLTLYGTPSL